MSLSVLPRLGSLAGFLLLTACVTINVYFPAAAAEKAADRFIEDVWGEGAAPAAPDTPTPPPDARLESSRSYALWQGALDFVIPTAEAQQANINISSPAINRLKSSMSTRHRQLAPFYGQGAVGLTGDGLLAVRDLNAVPLKDRGKVKQLVDAENRDRNQLYREIAQANNQPQWEAEIRSTFARQWIANARSGWWYQTGGRWRQK